MLHVLCCFLVINLPGVVESSSLSFGWRLLFSQIYLFSCLIAFIFYGSLFNFWKYTSSTETSSKIQEEAKNHRIGILVYYFSIIKLVNLIWLSIWLQFYDLDDWEKSSLEDFLHRLKPNFRFYIEKFPFSLGWLLLYFLIFLMKTVKISKLIKIELKGLT